MKPINVKLFYYVSLLFLLIFSTAVQAQSSTNHCVPEQEISETPYTSLDPIEVGPRADVGTETLSSKAGKSVANQVIGGLLGMGGGSSKSSKKPKTKRDPSRKQDYLSLVRPEVGAEVGVRAKWTNNGLLLSTRIEESSEKGTFQHVYLEDCTGRVLVPNRIDIYKIWSKIKLTVSWTKTTYVDGAIVDQQSGGWSESWIKDLGVFSRDGDAPAEVLAIWQRAGYQRAQAGIRQIGAYFNINPEQLAEMGQLGFIAHVTRPKQDPVITESFNAFINSNADENPIMTDPGIPNQGQQPTWSGWRNQCPVTRNNKRVNNQEKCIAEDANEQPPIEEVAAYDIGKKPCPVNPCDELKAKADKKAAEHKEAQAKADEAATKASKADANAKKLDADAKNKQADVADPADADDYIEDSNTKRRVTSRDLRLRQEASDELKARYDAGEISNDELQAGWRELNSPESLERLRERARKNKAQRQEKADAARKQADQARQDADAENEAAKKAQQEATDAKLEADKALKDWQDCVKKWQLECNEIKAENERDIEEQRRKIAAEVSAADAERLRVLREKAAKDAEKRAEIDRHNARVMQDWDDKRKAEQKDLQIKKQGDYTKYLLENIRDLGLISYPGFWEVPGIFDGLPDWLEKPVGDFLEDRAGGVISTEVFKAIGGLYNIIGALLDPCTASGMLRTVERLQQMTSSRTGRKYNLNEALDKTDAMCELLGKIKAKSIATQKASGGG